MGREAVELNITESEFDVIKKSALYFADNNAYAYPSPRNLKDNEKSIANLKLINSIISLQRKGVIKISNSLWDEIDNIIKKEIYKKYDDSLISLVRQPLENLFSLFLKDYEIIIKENFPILAPHFKLFKSLPVKCFIFLSLQEVTYISVFFCLDSTISNNEVIFCSREDISLIREVKIEDQRYFTVLHYGDKHYEVLESSSEPLFDILCPKLDYLHPKEYVTGSYPLRNLIYGRIKKELSDVFPKIKEEYLKS